MANDSGLSRRDFLTRMTAVAVGAPLLGVGQQQSARAAETPAQEAGRVIEISPGPHLFIDDHLIERTIRLTRTTHRPERLSGPVIPKAEPWHEMPLFFHRVIRDPETGRFRMWYNIRNNSPDVPFTVYAYAESDDGLHWRRPKLGLVAINGSTDNNLFMVVRAFGLGFVDDGPAVADPARRYKMAYYRISDPQGLCVAFSADGVRFTDYAQTPVLTDLGDIVDACYDPLRKGYVACFKAHSTEADGYRGSTPNAPEGYRRLVGESVSEDFIHWRDPWRVVVADPREPGMWEFYGMAPQVRGDLYLAFLRVLRDDLPADAGGPVHGIGWTELATSRDGENWTRHREPFLDRDPEAGTWDHAMAWVGDCVTVDDRDYVYYGGYSAGHKVGNRQIGVAVLRKNGFVSRDAGVRPGLLRTPMLRVDAAAITVNAEVGGELLVRVADRSGKPVSGFDWSDCAPTHGDKLAHPVRWNGKLASLRQEPVRLEFRLREAKLYGFDLTA